MLKLFTFLLIVGVVSTYHDPEDFHWEALTIDEIFTPQYANYLKGVLPSFLTLASATSRYISVAADNVTSFDELYEIIKADTIALASVIYRPYQ